MVSSVDAAYIAGFVDGEGSVMVSKLKPRPNVYGGLKNPSYMLRFKVGQVERSVLEWCREITQLGYVSTEYRNRGFVVSLWSASSLDALQILKIIQPYAHVKKAQIELGIYFYETSKWQHGSNHQTPHTETLRREAFYQTMKLLNAGYGVKKAGELLEHPLCSKDNQQPSHLNVIDLVEWKVQRLTGEDITANKPDTSARPERDDIVRTCK